MTLPALDVSHTQREWQGYTDMTIAEIEKLDRDFLTVQEVSECIHCEPQLIRDEAKKDPKFLGFPISKIGHSYKIPREGFVNWAKGMIPVMQVVSSNELFRSFERSGI